MYSIVFFSQNLIYFFIENKKKYIYIYLLKVSKNRKKGVFCDLTVWLLHDIFLFFVASKIPEAWFAHFDTCTNHPAGEIMI